MARGTEQAAGRGRADRAAASRREQRRALQQDLGRTQLLDAAEEVFGAKGYHDTTLKEIAELAEFSVGSVYSFFENKDDLFLSVFQRRGDQFLPEMRRIATGPGAPLEQLHALVDFEVGFFREHPHFGRLYLRSSSTIRPMVEVAPSSALAENFRVAMDLQADVLARGQAAGEVRDGDPHALARLFSGLVAAFQSVDPAVVSDDPGAAEPLPLEDLHDIIERGLRRP